VRANLLMLVAAMIWGSAFVAQRLSLDTIGPFLFTGLRFLLGACVVLALLAFLRPSTAAAKPRVEGQSHAPPAARAPLIRFTLLRDGTWLGLLLAVAISLQQIGLQYTKIANAGFISSLYVVIVPLIGVVQVRFILPNLAMLLINLESLVVSLVLWGVRAVREPSRRVR
jgi:drug/metabolite transporter (DMT)-like permease